MLGNPYKEQLTDKHAARFQEGDALRLRAHASVIISCQLDEQLS